MFQLALFENATDFFVKGGVFMAVLLVCSFVALTVILLRSFALRRRAVIPALIEKEINKIKPGEDPEHLRHLIQDDASPLSRIVEVAVRPYNVTKQETLEVVQSRARQEIVRLESGLFILEIVVGISPLLGLLGGIIWGTGTMCNVVAGASAGFALSYAIGQSAPMVGALWGVFAWKEFAGAGSRAKIFLVLMFVFYGLAILLLTHASS